MTVALTVPHAAPGRRPAPGGSDCSLEPLRQLTTTVPREYVHRSTITEVFLTDWRGTGPGAWTVTAQWPRAHSFYAPAHGMHDPVMLAETVRQTAILLSHVGHDVPLGHPAIWGRLQYSVTPTALALTGAPADLELHVTDHDIVRRAGRLSTMRQMLRIVRDGRYLGSVEGTLSCHTPAVYRRLRGEYADLELALARRLPLPEAVDPALVGRDRATDVVLAPASGRDRWQLRVDTTHPVLFDHPVDHVPGMLMVEAARQAAYAATGPAPSLAAAMDCSFLRYAELDAPCWVRTEAAGRDSAGLPRVAVTVEQHGRPVFTATVTSAPVG
ncbi:transcriptional regulator [Streptomyces sp. Ru73]|uniref:ScbA/BarX family gamma-butyrolactone biosynthesis protein n=1 Tax=Streptomyces sp. Ru73 TaxID=2080748 RepID=UPI000CDD7F72|nr:ScbA/BarX family gamma-butyrolactone biosynthesis protein [Streptomyces sp. Ru73]POX37529.1 transcriptional regulator [Streptomyces sp. Ru73]